jgi:hypothetical protein
MLDYVRRDQIDRQVFDQQSTSQATDRLRPT